MLTRVTRSGARLFSISNESVKVVNNVAKQQFTISVSGDDAVLGYEQSGKDITFIHTDVPPVFQGKGIGRKLAKCAFDHALKNKLDVTCQCHFLAKYYEDNRNQYKNLNVRFDLDPEE